jgi:DNA-binding protein HU-beta
MRFSKGGSPVNKNDLVALVADAAGLSKIDATKAVDAVFDGIIQSLKKGEEVRLVGFGTFDVSDRAASEGRNPRTGEKINIPASKQPKFKAGKTLKLILALDNCRVGV